MRGSEALGVLMLTVLMAASGCGRNAPQDESRGEAGELRAAVDSETVSTGVPAVEELSEPQPDTEAPALRALLQAGVIPDFEEFDVLDSLWIGEFEVILGETFLDSAVAVLGGRVQQSRDHHRGDFICYEVDNQGEVSYLILRSHIFSEPPGKIMVVQQSTWQPGGATCESSAKGVEVRFEFGLSLGSPRDSVLQVLGDPAPDSPRDPWYGPYPGEIAYFERVHPYYAEDGEYLTSLENTVVAVFDKGALVGLRIRKVLAG